MKPILRPLYAGSQRMVNDFKNDKRGEGAVTDLAVAGILVMISFVIWFAFLPLLNAAAAKASADPNASSDSVTLVKIIPFLVVAAGLIGAVVYIVRAAKKLGGD